jgi:transcriptional antiterminator NusG
VYPWYAIHTRSNCEKSSAALLEARGLEPYLPLYPVRKRWTDRVIENTIPLFPGYVFCRFDTARRTPILDTPGVVSIVGFGGKPAAIANDEIDAIQRVLGSGQPAEPASYLSEGQRIRVSRGPLKDIEGILIQKRSWRLVISVHMLCRSLAVDIDADCVTAI